MHLRPADIQILGHWLSPDFVVPAALAHSGDEVLGADGAYQEVRALIREYSRFVRQREQEPRASLGLASALRAMGYVGVFQPVHRVSSDWLETSVAMWGEARGEINGWTDPIEVGDVRQSTINRAVVRVLGILFDREPGLNLAVLRGRVYQRTTPHLMIHTEARGIEGPRSYVLDPRGLDDADLRVKMRKARVGILEAEKHELRHLGFQLMRAWAKVGLIASPAACMISLSGQNGHAALAPFNGIPLAVQVGAVKNGTVTVYLTIDHRVYSGSHADFIYRFIEDGVKRCV
jgi:hypothetical protein